MIKKRKEKFLDIETEIIDVSSECIDERGINGGVWHFGDHLNLEDDIIIGMSPTNYHTFIIAKDIEAHPRFSFNKIKLRPSRKSSIRAGLFIRIRDLNEIDLQCIREQIDLFRGKRTLSCVEGVRQSLYYGAGLAIPFFANKDLYISQFLYKLIKFGIWTPEGKRLNIQIFKTRDKSLEEMFKEICYTESYFLWAGILSFYLYKILEIFSSFSVPAIEPKLPAFFDVHKNVLNPQVNGRIH